MTSTPNPSALLVRAALTTVADAAAAEYDLSTQLVRWTERQRSEARAARARRRRRVELVVAAAVVLLLGTVALAGRWHPADRRTIPARPADELPGSGLLVGSLRASFEATHDNFGSVSTYQTSLRLTVHPDGTGSLRRADRDFTVPVRFVGTVRGQVDVEAEPGFCADSLVVALTFVTAAQTQTVTDARAGPCYLDDTFARQLVGAVFTRVP